MEQTKDFLSVKEAYQWYVSSSLKFKEKNSILKRTSSLNDLEKLELSTMIMVNSIFRWCIMVSLSALFLKAALGLVLSVFAIGIAFSYMQILSLTMAAFLVLGVLRGAFEWITR